MEEMVRDEELDAILERCAVSIESHCRVFHPDRFNRPFSKGHHKLFEIVDDPSVKKILVLAHRGFGKTSIFNYAIPSQAIMFKKSRYIVPASATSDLAVQQSENLKRHLTSSPQMKAILGNIKTDQFSKEAWVTPDEIMVFPRGQGQQVRGQLYINSRPDLLIADDLEKSKAMKSVDLRRELKEWFHTDFELSIDRSRTDWRMLVVGTVLHEDSLLNELKSDSDWTTIEMPLCDENFKSYWPSFMGDEDIKAEHDKFKDRGQLTAWYRENMNIAMPAEDAVFKQEYFKYYEEGDHDFLDKDRYEHVILVDPTRTSTAHSCYSAIVGVTIDTDKNRFYIRDVVNKRITTDELYEEMIDMADRLGANVIGVEDAGLAEFIRKPLEDYMSRRGKVYEIVWLKPRSPAATDDTEVSGNEARKARRIAQLAPYYRTGRVYHNRACCDTLEHQLCQFPRGTFVDVIDALAYVLQLTELGGRYFGEDMPDDDTPGRRSREEQEDWEYAQLEEKDEEPIRGSCYSVRLV